VRGLVDSADLSLNISREVLQHDRQLKIIAKSIEKTVKSELKKLLTTDREKYEKFWEAFGLQIKFGCYNGYGMNKELLQDLLIFKSSAEQKYVTLDEYISRLQTDQKYIYYAAADSLSRADSLPQTELLKSKGIEILYLTESVDEFAVQVIGTYSEKPFKNISSGDLELGEADKAKSEEVKKQTEDNKETLDLIKEALGGKIKEARLSERLVTHPCCITADGDISLEMERTLARMPENAEHVTATKILEINPEHPIWKKLCDLGKSDKQKLSDYAKILYNSALLVEGMPIENPKEYSEMVTNIMTG
jgi:molecular chaperone HtpG